MKYMKYRPVVILKKSMISLACELNESVSPEFMVVYREESRQFVVAKKDGEQWKQVLVTANLNELSNYLEEGF